MAERIDLEHRWALLAERQLLHSSGRADRTVADVATALALLHSTDPVTPYLSIHARSDASVGDVDDALYGGVELMRFTSIRRTVFAMDHGAAAAAYGAVNAILADKLRTQLLKWLDASEDVTEPAATFLQRTEHRVLEYLDRGGPATGIALSSAVEELQVTVDPQPGASYSKPIRITSKVLEILGAELRIVRWRPTGANYTSGAWRWRVATADEARLRGGAVEAGEAASCAALLERYLRSFGPATVTDMTWWTGSTRTRVRSALDTLGARPVDLGTDELGFVSADDSITVTGVTPEISLLPGLDSTTMGWKQRSWYVDDTAAAGVFDRNGNAGPTIWFGGRVIGVWTQRGDGAIVTELFEPITGDTDDRLQHETARLTAWLDEVRVKWRYPTPITKRLST